LRTEKLVSREAAGETVACHEKRRVDVFSVDFGFSADVVAADIFRAPSIAPRARLIFASRGSAASSGGDTALRLDDCEGDDILMWMAAGDCCTKANTVSDGREKAVGAAVRHKCVVTFLEELIELRGAADGGLAAARFSADVGTF
jgi:hypothetical protein